MSEESAVPSLKLPKVPAKKPKKYIHIQGFADLDDKGALLIHLSSKDKSVFKVSDDAISQEVFQTKIGDKTVSFANVVIPYSEERINLLKTGTNRFTELVVPADPSKPTFGPGKAPGAGGGPTGPIGPLEFVTIIGLGNVIEKFIVYGK